MFKLVSTRDSHKEISFKEAVVNGLASDGGLYAPINISDNKFKIEAYLKLNYQELAQKLFRIFASDFTDQEIEYVIKHAYQDSFTTKEVVSLDKYQDNYLLNLYLGPTSAFKDVALQLLPQLLEKSLNDKKNKVMILTATSGDTGKAALEGFKNLANIDICVFFPYQKVSQIQDLQMRTTCGSNTHVASLNTDFDGCQKVCKEIFNDQQFNKELNKANIILSSANSINIGRLTPQIVYYFYAYKCLLEKKEINLNEKINFVVPTGNFGNILAGYYAKLMGLPINKLIVATNENDVLKDFINTGCYSIKERDLIQTISPSMDILISSNVERLLFELYDHNDEAIKELMLKLDKTKSYTINKEAKAKLQKVFKAYACSNEESKEIIKKIYNKEKKILDPHTACAYQAYDLYLKESNDKSKTVILQTASCYKFAKDVYQALTSEVIDDEFLAIEKISQLTDEKIPENLACLNKLASKHNSKVDIKQAKDYIRSKLPCLE